MIIGKHREAVIDNIRKAAEAGEFYAKVEIDDPVLTPQQAKTITERHLKMRGTPTYRVKAWVARGIATAATAVLNRDTEIIGDTDALNNGAIITSNHFGPLENTVIRRFVRKKGKKRLNIVSQVTNFAMTGFIGFLMNYADTVPLAPDLHYVNGALCETLGALLQKREAVLIYPEQEMWFQYRKPRPLKRGAYYFAAKLGVPVVCCFVEMIDRPDMDTDRFHKVRYVLHVLDTLYPDPNKSVKENSVELSERDYALKAAAYEKAYGRPLDYRFEPHDIAGWVGDAHD